MAHRSKPPLKLVPILLRRKDGVIQTYYIRGREKAINHPQRPSRAELRARRGKTPARGERRRDPARQEPSTQPPRARSEPPTIDVRRGATYSTWFRATGSGLDFLVSPEELEPQDNYARFVQALREKLPGEFNVPLAFASNHEAILGQVVWDGIVPLVALLEELNINLQAFGSEVPGFDFRDVYPIWSYKYKIVETIAGEDFVVFETEDHS